MSNPLFDAMTRRGLIRAGKPASATILRLSPSDLLDLTSELAEISSSAGEVAAPSVLRHTASLPLGAGREHCRNVECRLRSGTDLTQFALLYSDTVYIRNYFTGHSYTAAAVEVDPDDARHDLLNDVRVLTALRPAIEAGYIQLYTPPAFDCPQCVANETFGRNADKRLRKAGRELSKRFLNEVDVDLFFDEGEWTTSFSGPEELLGHKGSIFTLEPPDALKKHPRILQRVTAGEMVRLSKTAQRQLGIHRFLAEDVIRSVAFDMVANQQLGTSLLTDWLPEVEVLNAVARDPGVEERNRIALQHMTSLVPFLTNVPASAILRLRERESEAFLRYRAALNAAIEQYRGEKQFSAGRAKQIYGDVIEPKLAELDQKFKSARKSLARELRHEVVAWVGAISFGIYTGLLPASVAAVAKGVGITALVAALLTRAMKDPAAALREEQFYFLWRVRQARES